MHRILLASAAVVRLRTVPSQGRLGTAATAGAFLPNNFLGGALTANVSIASQYFTLILDTGSASILTYGQLCTNCNTTRLLNTSGLVRAGTTSGAFVAGSFNGTAYYAPVSVGGLPAVSVKVAVSSYDALGDPRTGQGEPPSLVQGVLGLGPPRLLFLNTSPWLPPQWLFTVDARAGLLSVGTNPTGAVVSMTPILPPYYGVNLQYIGFNGLTFRVPPGAQTILDTGTSINLLPQSMYNAVANAFVSQYGAALSKTFGNVPSLMCRTTCYTSIRAPSNVSKTFPPMLMAMGAQPFSSPAFTSWFLNVGGMYTFAFQPTALNKVVLGFPFFYNFAVTFSPTNVTFSQSAAP